MINDNMLDFLKKLSDGKYDTIILSMEVPGGSIALEIESFNFWCKTDIKTLEISSSKDNTLFQIDMKKIVDCIKYDEIEGYHYNIKFDSWSIDITIV